MMVFSDVADRIDYIDLAQQFSAPGVAQGEYDRLLDLMSELPAETAADRAWLVKWLERAVANEWCAEAKAPLIAKLIQSFSVCPEPLVWPPLAA